MFKTFFVLFAFYAAALSDDDKTCEEMVTAEMKMKLLKDSLQQVKDLFPRCRDADEDPGKCSKRGTALAHMNLAIESLEGLNLVGSGKPKVCPKCPDPIIGRSSGPADCQEILNNGYKKSGIYTIYLKDRLKGGTRGLKVYCDMDTEGGGWTVIQRRGNFSTQTDFHQNWDSYKKGFGDLDSNFWIGNDNIFTLTNQAVYTLRIDMKNINKEYRYSQHGIFFIGDENSKYMLYVQDFVGNVSDDLRTQHKIKFSTKDQQNDGRNANDQCTRLFHGAWWYPQPNCGHVNINGLYMPGVNNQNSAWWWGWTGYVGLLFTEMKIRPRNFESKRE